jgi:hypothetical protein
MTAATYTTAHLYACPDGHAGPHGEPLRMVVPAGLDLAPACTVCGKALAQAGGPLGGRWRVDECCVPAEGGKWYGPRRDPGTCGSCFGTQRHALCLACYAVNCDGDHGEECLACDGTGRQDCPDCDGEGHVYNEFGGDEGLCPAPRCVAGRVSCEACGGTRNVTS